MHVLGSPERSMRQVLQPGNDAQADRAYGDANRIEEPADRAPRDSRDEKRVQQVVLGSLVGVGLVGLDARGASTVLAWQEPSEKVMDRAEGADPTAEDTPEYHREREKTHAPEKPSIDRMGGQRGHRADERVREQ